MPDSHHSYKLTPMAENDLEEIWVYSYKTWSIDQADRYYQDIIQIFENLASGIKSGQPVKSRLGYFKQIAGSHLVFFRHKSTHIEIIRILHQQMDPDRHL